MLTKVIHSQSKTAWNVVGKTPGHKYKIARVPYDTMNDPIFDTRQKAEALEIAMHISKSLESFKP